MLPLAPHRVKMWTRLATKRTDDPQGFSGSGTHERHPRRLVPTGVIGEAGVTLHLRLGNDVKYGSDSWVDGRLREAIARSSSSKDPQERHDLGSFELFLYRRRVDREPRGSDEFLSRISVVGTEEHLDP